MSAKRIRKRVHLYLPIELAEVIEDQSEVRNLSTSSYVTELLAKHHNVELGNYVLHRKGRKTKSEEGERMCA